ncbi:hypothetical protein ABZ387_35020 [Streptomyces flaveolus]|uniref:hypothetical protein n=1 Tax=Streptomyces flaveolus TaxID=67297 RepID=UPI0034063CEB
MRDGSSRAPHPAWACRAHQLKLGKATAAFREAVAQPGIAEAFDRDFGGLPQGSDSRHRAA